MGLFDLFIKRNKENNNIQFKDNNTIKNDLKYADSSTISPDEKPFYQSDDYYTL